MAMEDLSIAKPPSHRRISPPPNYMTDNEVESKGNEKQNKTNK